jgi:hypothetical protein
MRISKEIQETVKFLADIIQTLFIVLGGGWAVYTFATQQEADIKATQRELARPYYEKQLSLYLDASRVVAHLAKQPTGREKEELEARFWELYWGELAFVESNDIELLMVSFCKEYFKGSPECQSNSASTELPGSAISIAQRASEEIRNRWAASAQ